MLIYLHRSINLTTVKHEDEIVQVPLGSLPRHILSLLEEEFSSSQSQCGLHNLCPEEDNDEE